MFMGLAIFKELKHQIIILDFNDTLTVLNGNTRGFSIVDCDQVLENAKEFSKKTPQSMMLSDFVGIVDFGNNSEHLAQNEYFSKRWWEMDRLEYNENIHTCLISAEDAI
jgi:hypothetical protein